MRHAALPLSSIALLSAALFISSSHAGNPKEFDGDFHPAKVRYMTYSGDLGEKEAPKFGKQKVSLLIEGALAQEMFESLGRDQKDACDAGSG